MLKYLRDTQITYSIDINILMFYWHADYKNAIFNKIIENTALQKFQKF